jgi:dTDP-4-dehydrorhamnose 3,5-epimerase
MKFSPGQLSGSYLIEAERRHDERGYFARVWCEREYLAHGLDPRIVQCSVSYNEKKGTLRGMHYQLPPSAETKVVRCVRGALYDVIVDLRPRSKTFLQWMGVELTAENGRMLYIPKGFAHGFQTLAAGTEVSYQMSEFYTPEAAGGFRWDDPLVGIQWPPDERIISERDRGYPDVAPEQFNLFRADA